VSPHKLRHTNGSRLLDKGMPPMQVAAHLGHSLEVLSSTYAHKMRNVMDTDVLD
jgi:integrase